MQASKAYLGRPDAEGTSASIICKVRTKAPRPGRNPRTGELIPIAARRVVTFHASSKLKELIQGEGSGS